MQKSVKQYLREFLNDPRVIDLPFYLRWPLVNLSDHSLSLSNTLAAYEKI